LFLSPPSIWVAAVAHPKRKSFGSLKASINSPPVI
jgi:hypothetical protein